MKDFDIAGLINGAHPAPGYACGGQPTVAQLTAAAQSGLKRVITLRPASEDSGYDEAAAARKLALDYVVLGIAGGGDLNRANVDRLDALLNAQPEVPTLVHCASGNRVGALMALRAAWVQGRDTEAALAIGRQWGLKAMEPAVRGLLG